MWKVAIEILDGSILLDFLRVTNDIKIFIAEYKFSKGFLKNVIFS